MALAVTVGADISTTLIAQILVFDLSWLSPGLIIIGVAGLMFFEHSGRKKHLAQSIIGLGLMLLSLSLIKQASAPLTGSPTLPLILAPLSADPVTAIIIAALLTYIMHSSLAAVLLFAALASNSIIDLQLGALLVLGANLGGAFIAFVVTYKDGPHARRITIGNIIMRATTVLIAFLCLPAILSFLSQFDINTAHQLVNLHMLLSLMLATIFLPSIYKVASLSEKIIKIDQNTTVNESDPVYLDEQALDTPVIALASAARETLRMAEMVELMLEQTIESFKENNENLASKISKKDNTVDDLYRAIKIYMTRVSHESLDPKEADRYLQIMTFATNLEHIGDIIDKSLVKLAKKKIKNKERFSDDGWTEIKEFHAQVLKSMKLAQIIFLSEDTALARQLVDNKRIIREAERQSSTYHFNRLRDGLPETIATSSLHLDIIRDYRRINSYITSVAYSIIENAEKYGKKRRY